MHEYASLEIYNASAGAGKTYTLVKAYLKSLLATNRSDRYKYILAITFTNKAVGEMKQRIVSQLSDFAEKDILSNPNSMFKEIASELAIDHLELHQRAHKTLHSLIHNYAAFEVSTIDKFTHKIIRTFAKDLRLSMNFDVEMDTDFVLQQTVDQLITKIGTDKELTEVLISFALQKIEDDKSWDISFDLQKIAKLLLKENDKYYLKSLRSKSFKDFRKLKISLREEIGALTKNNQTVAEDVLKTIASENIQHEDFFKELLPKWFTKVASGDFSVKFNSKWVSEIESTSLYTAKTDAGVKERIESLRPLFAQTIRQLKRDILEIKFLKAFVQSVTPLSVISAIQKELEALKKDQNILLISDFNDVISEAIVNQPAPFIYERLGEKFKHYFIDEFQDTSSMQWNNLIPLIYNAITQENLAEEKGSLMIVGDPKQSIYRWRGGNVEQFVDLSSKNLPFYLEDSQIKIQQLPTNYRSFSEIINFNNSFFHHIGNLIKGSPYQQIYSDGAIQQTNEKTGGFVSINFVEGKHRNESQQAYAEKTLEIIQSLEEFEFSEICILTRKKDQGIFLANYLIEHNIPVISSESLLIMSSEKVLFIIDLLQLLQQPENDELKIRALQYFYRIGNRKENEHEFYSTFLKKDIQSFCIDLLNLEITALHALSFYEKVEALCKASGILEQVDAYVVYFLDFVFDFTTKYHADINTFITFWEQKKKALSIVAPESQNAVSIMTIHKSKGLEFPVVLFPFADLNIYDDLETNNWLTLEEEKNNFKSAYVPFGNYFEELSEHTAKAFKDYRNKLALDHYNLLYVALTRAIEQLHIISKKESVDSTKFSGMFMDYLAVNSSFDSNLDTHTIGNDKRVSKKIQQSIENKSLRQIIATPKEQHRLNILTTEGAVWGTHQERAISRGNLIHSFLEQINTLEDIKTVIGNAIIRNELTSMEAESISRSLTNIITHPELKIFFQKNMETYNEKEIVSENGKILIPDRLVIQNNSVCIIDYKTGTIQESHLNQIQEYGNVLATMGYTIDKKILVYLNEEVLIKYVD